MVSGKGNSGVVIIMNEKEVSVHRGRNTVEDLKDKGSIPQAHDLEQIIDGKMTPLPDDGSVTIKGGEIFVSHPKDGESS